ncbi:MAG: hydrolase 1, exosortase A system-associated [Rhodocyclaceae bacterium]
MNLTSGHVHGQPAPEQAVVFAVESDSLVGVLHHGEAQAHTGVLIVVGGPQYRVGSHRQFLLLARRLAAAGVPVFRFDYRGMGDASGSARDFELVRDDISAAVDTFVQQVPTLRHIVIWGLCDAASAALDYAWRDARVSGLVLLNPWVRTEAGRARAYLRHYYLQRLTSRAFWSKLVRGGVNPLASLRSLTSFSAGLLRSRRSAQAPAALGPATSQRARIDATPLLPGQPLPERMAEGWRRFGGRILLILAGEDLTAAEFRDLVAASPVWQALLKQPGVSRCELAEANHTFARQAWRTQVEDWTLEWLSQDDAAVGHDVSQT